MPVYAGYKTWCDQCGWNLETPPPPERQSLFEKLYAALSRKSSQHLLEEMIQGRPLKVGFTLSKLLAILIAACIHSVTLALIALGIWLSVFTFPSVRFLGIFLGLTCLVMVWFFLFPRFPKIVAKPLPRERFPILYQTVDRIARALGSPLVDSINYDIRYNAAFGQFGWRRKRTLILGLPLLSALDDQELVALLAHELAHNVNGDPNRGFFLGTALYSLATWYEVIHPQNRWHINAGMAAALLFFVNLVCLPIAGLLWIIGYALSHLLWYDTQRAEYLADWLAAQASGTSAQLAVLSKCQLKETFENTLKFAYLDQQMESFFADLKQRIAQVPAREVERLRRIEKLASSGIDSTHPPTAHRVEFLKAQHVPEAQVALSSSEFAQLEQELEPLMKNVQKRISELDEITFREVFGISW